MQNPLIMAVEPDRLQADQIRSMFDRQFSAELVIAESTARALAGLGDRIPELVLMSALIRPKDEAALVQWLRELGPAGRHVQTVVIPVLTAPEPMPGRKLGSLSFGRERPLPSAPDSCDPSVFADWITVYLDLASSQRHSRA